MHSGIGIVRRRGLGGGRGVARGGRRGAPVQLCQAAAAGGCATCAGSAADVVGQCFVVSFLSILAR